MGTVLLGYGCAAAGTKTDMEKLGYPRARGDVYLCYPIELIREPGIELTKHEILALRRRVAPSAVWGEPVVNNWLDVIVASRSLVAHD